MSFVAIPEYNSWDCEKCSSTPGFTSCMYNGCWKSPTGCCHPNVADGFQGPCKSHTGQAIEDPCLRKIEWIKILSNFSSYYKKRYIYKHCSMNAFSERCTPLSQTCEPGQFCGANGYCKGTCVYVLSLSILSRFSNYIIYPVFVRNIRISLFFIES